MADYSAATFWFVLPSPPMFLVIPLLLNRGASFRSALTIDCGLTVALYLAMVWVPDQFGVMLQQRRTIARVDHLPVEIHHEGVDIPRGGGTIVHVIAVLIHIERDQRRAIDRTIHVIERPVVVQRLGVAVVTEDAPARSACQRHRGATELGCPPIEAAEPAVERLLD